jgi:putative transposase
VGDMTESLSKIYVHIVFSTKNHSPWISEELEKELYPYMSTILKKMDCPTLIMGGFSDHIHILCNLSRKYQLSKILETVKKSSSKWVKTRGEDFKNFHWQDGYGAFSVSPSVVERVRFYIKNQRTHHQKHSYKDEFLSLLDKHNIKYDVKDLWD